MKQTFEEWKKKANEICWNKHGCSLDDMADCCYYDWYEDGVSPRGAVSRAVKAQME